MKLKEIMKTDFPALSPGNTVRYAAELLLSRGANSAPVVENGDTLVGIITDSHIKRVVRDGLDSGTLVSELMNRNVFMKGPDDSIEDLLDYEHGQVPIVDRGRLVGIVTRVGYARATAESHMKLSRELDAIINSSTIMVLSIDNRENISIINRAAEKFFGVSSRDITGKHVSAVPHCIGLVNILRTGSVEALHKENINDSIFITGSFPIRNNKEVIGAVSFYQDISELEKMTSELKKIRELNKDLDAIIESSYDGIFVTDGDANVLRINKSYAMMTGYNTVDFIGRNMRDLVKDGTYSESVTLLVLEKNAPASLIQETSTDKTLLVLGNPVFDDDGKVIRVVTTVRDLTELHHLNEEIEKSQTMSQFYKKELNSLRLQCTTQKNMVVNSPKMRDFMDMVMRLAQVDSTILITGESGTGKELVAESIHEYSSRSEKPLIKVNCGAIPEDLLESELFGYETGAFTGARKGGRPGFFEMADQGVIFLDEIAELPMKLQAKFLRVLQFKEVNRIGGGKTRKVNVRIVAATNKNLYEMVLKKQFRDDLYYRLNVVPVHIPPLRERKDDIPHMVAHFIQMFNRSYSMNRHISPEVVDILIDYEWPGNIRELKNLIERLVVISSGDVITRDDLPVHIGRTLDIPGKGVSVSRLMPMKDAVESVERQLLEMVYGAKSTTRQMAEVLKIDASTIVRKAAKYGVSSNRQ